MDMKLVTFASLLVVFASFCWQHAAGTCILDSDFGFTLNCGFKKSGLFRVKNLGGVKGYVGLGFSVGDELGFPQSLSTTDVDAKRRSVQGVRGNSIGVKPAADADADADADEALRSRKALNGVQTVTSVNGVKRNKSSGRSISTGRSRAQTARNIVIPPFKPILPAPPKFPANSAPQYSQLKMAPTSAATPNITRPTRLAYAGALQSVNSPSLGGVVVPPFQALPASITKLTSVANTKSTSQLSHSQAQAFRNSLKAATSHFQVRKDVVAPVYDHGLADNTLTLRTLSSSASQQQLLPSDHVAPSAPAPAPASFAYQLKPDDTLMGHSIKALAQASNLTIEAITAAIAIRQQQLLKQQQQAPPTTTTTTTTAKPVTLPPVNTKKYPLSSVSKVMNAPKEYYPVGYDKNFDDNFASRVELPETSFYCGDQKHFPGLYADEDLGCMVFHVCAFTDDGLIMKSFLCPESTLFDQTILKCNWWFYTDCKTSAKLYDSNIPISKSYQLMKALAFFSAYGKKS